MKDITPILDHYREVACHLWNTGFLLLDTDEDIWQLHEQYADIASQLFSAFVLGSIGRMDYPMLREDEAGPQPLMFMRVVSVGEGVPIFINRTTPPSGYWDDPVDRIFKEEDDLRFLRYFDFDLVGVRDLEYYLVRIVAFPKHPHLVGRNALLRVQDAKLILDENVS